MKRCPQDSGLSSSNTLHSRLAQLFLGYATIAVPQYVSYNQSVYRCARKQFLSPSYIIHEIFKMLVVFLTIISIATSVQAVAFRLPVNTFEIPGSHVS